MPLQDVADLAQRTAEAEGFEVVQVKVDASRRVRMWVDLEPDGVTMEHCTDLTRKVNAAFQSEGLDPGNYHLEVQSPGLDRLLVREEHFVRFLGRRVTVHLRRSAGERSKYQGTLTGYEAGTVHVEVEGAAMSFGADEVREVRLVPELPPGFDKSEPETGKRPSGRQRKPKGKGKGKRKRK